VLFDAPARDSLNVPTWLGRSDMEFDCIARRRDEHDERNYCGGTGACGRARTVPYVASRKVTFTTLHTAKGLVSRRRRHWPGAL